MKLRETSRPRRGAFTLVELVVVIAIIALLVAISAAAYMRFMTKGPELQARHDISELANGIQAFETAFHVDYVPSRVRLYRDLNTYNNDPSQVAQDTRQYLLRLWPRLKGQPYTNGYYINWDGTGPPVNGDSPIDLEGDQCLVFFLGGMPANVNGNLVAQGFASDPTDPSLSPSSSPSRKGPFFDFPSARLTQVSGRSGAGAAFPSFQDPWAKNVYAYFSSYKSANGYLRYMGATSLSDCQTLGVSPYALSVNANGTGQFPNPNSFQIVCAGRDGVFGKGSMPGWAISGGNVSWSPATAGSTQAFWPFGAAQAPTNPPNGGKDDMSNFHDLKLGATE
jgi:prepilin-type N-terminal cleavage/methylation domain-containing protein